MLCPAHMVLLIVSYGSQNKQQLLYIPTEYSLIGFFPPRCVYSAVRAEYLYSKTCLKWTPYIPETWTNGK